MGRWLARLREAEKNAQTLSDETPKTPKNTPPIDADGERDQVANSATRSSDDDSAMWFEERAAILEYDEGLSRAEAERLAREQAANVVPLRRRSP